MDLLTHSSTIYKLYGLAIAAFTLSSEEIRNVYKEEFSERNELEPHSLVMNSSCCIISPPGSPTSIVEVHEALEKTPENLNKTSWKALEESTDKSSVAKQLCFSATSTGNIDVNQKIVHLVVDKVAR